MKILQVTSMYYPELKFGGPPQKIHALSRGLVERGHEVKVVTVRSDNPRARNQITLDKVRVQYLPWAGRGSAQLHGGFGKLLAAVRWADVIHCYGLYNMLCPVTALIARRLGCPYILEPLGMYVPRARSVRAKQVYHRLFTRRMARASAAVIAQSPAEAQELLDLVEPHQLVQRRNGIDLSVFRRLPDRAAFRRHYGIDAATPLILYIGRISPIKNLEQLVLAFKAARMDDARLALVGPMLEPDYADALRKLIETSGLKDSVMFTGPLYNEDKLSALAAADLFVLPSISESYGNAAAEAVAAGVPVLLTEGCGVAPAIDGRAGLAVPLGVESLAQGLRKLLYNQELRAEFARKRELVLEDLSWEEPLDQTEALYTRIARGTAA